MLNIAGNPVSRAGEWAWQASARFGSALLQTLRIAAAVEKAERSQAAACTPLQSRLKSLADCGDPASLRSAVCELCAEFGKVIRLDIMMVAEAQKRRALCLLRLESQTQEAQLMESLGASRFGNDVLVIVDFPPTHAAK